MSSSSVCGPSSLQGLSSVFGNSTTDIKNISSSTSVTTPSRESARRRLSFDPKVFKLETFYLDLAGYRGVKRLEKDICTLGGKIEKFLSKDITCVVTAGWTSRASSDGKAQSPQPVLSPLSLNSPALRRGRSGSILARASSRGQALLLKAQSSQNHPSEVNAPDQKGVLTKAQQLGIRIVGVLEILATIKEARKNGVCIGDDNSSHSPFHNEKEVKTRPLPTPYLKIEDSSQRYKPISHTLTSFPFVNVTNKYGSPFDTIGAVKSTCTKPNTNCSIVTHLKSQQKGKNSGVGKYVFQSHSKVTQNTQVHKQGYCECCDVFYQNLNKHIESDSHKEFIKQKENFNSLDNRINSCPTLDTLVSKLKTLYSPDDENSNDSTGGFTLESKVICEDRDSGYKTPSPDSKVEIIYHDKDLGDESLQAESKKVTTGIEDNLHDTDIAKIISGQTLKSDCNAAHFSMITNVKPTTNDICDPAIEEENDFSHKTIDYIERNQKCSQKSDDDFEMGNKLSITAGAIPKHIESVGDKWKPKVCKGMADVPSESKIMIVKEKSHFSDTQSKMKDILSCDIWKRNICKGLSNLPCELNKVTEKERFHSPDNLPEMKDSILCDRVYETGVGQPKTNSENNKVSEYKKPGHIAVDPSPQETQTKECDNRNDLFEKQCSNQSYVRTHEQTLEYISLSGSNTEQGSIKDWNQNVCESSKKQTYVGRGSVSCGSHKESDKEADQGTSSREQDRPFSYTPTATHPLLASAIQNEYMVHTDTPHLNDNLNYTNVIKVEGNASEHVGIGTSLGEIQIETSEDCSASGSTQTPVLLKPIPSDSMMNVQENSTVNNKPLSGTTDLGHSIKVHDGHTFAEKSRTPISDDNNRASVIQCLQTEPNTAITKTDDTYSEARSIVLGADQSKTNHQEIELVTCDGTSGMLTLQTLSQICVQPVSIQALKLSGSGCEISGNSTGNNIVDGVGNFSKTEAAVVEQVQSLQRKEKYKEFEYLEHIVIKDNHQAEHTKKEKINDKIDIRQKLSDVIEKLTNKDGNTTSTSKKDSNQNINLAKFQKQPNVTSDSILCSSFSQQNQKCTTPRRSQSMQEKATETWQLTPSGSGLKVKLTKVTTTPSRLAPNTLGTPKGYSGATNCAKEHFRLNSPCIPSFGTPKGHAPVSKGAKEQYKLTPSVTKTPTVQGTPKAEVNATKGEQCQHNTPTGHADATISVREEWKLTPNGGLKMKFCKVSVTPLSARRLQESIKWRVQRSGDCKLTFSAEKNDKVVSESGGKCKGRKRRRLVL